MKKLILISLTLFALMFSSCEKENCKEAVLGTYTGTLTTNGRVEELNITISGENDEKDVILVFSTPLVTNYPDITLSGTLNAECATITIPSQVIFSSSFTGSLSINNLNLTGSFYASGYPNIINCSK